MKFALALLIFALITPIASQAQPVFEVVLAGYESDSCSGVPSVIPILQGLEWIEGDDDSSGILGIPGTVAAAGADGRHVFSLNDRGPAAGFDVIVETSVWGGDVFYANDDYEPVTIAQAANGRLFVVATQGVNAFLLMISTAGALEATYPIPLTQQLAVGVDNCTLYYPLAGSIERMNGCTGAPLAPFALLASPVHDVFPLPDGQVLAAAGTAVVLLNAAGVVTRTFPLTNYGFDPTIAPAQIALGATGVLYVVAGDCDVDGAFPTLLRIAFDSGAELSRQFVDVTTVASLVLGTAAATAIPTASETALMILAGILAVAGARIVRTR